MKFTNVNLPNSKINNFQDFSVIDILHEDFKLPNSKNEFSLKSDLNMIPFTERSSYYERF